MDDRAVLDGIVGIGRGGSPVSGPWRLTVWDSGGASAVKIYVFSEEHSNTGSCPEHRHFSTLASEILQKTRGVHLLVENFIHANDATAPRPGVGASMAQACSPVNTGILNNLRSCLEVMKMNSSFCPDGCEKRVHFIDPRVDMVSVLPDGKLFQAIAHFARLKASKGHFDEAVLTIYEAIVHPLSGLLPDRRNLMGRLVGAFDVFRSKMTPAQRATFDRIWARDITGGISDINGKYVRLNQTYSSNRKSAKPSLAKFTADVESIMEAYKRYTNKFMDTWLLAHVFMIQNTPTTNGMVLYLGSLHGLEVEKYFQLHGFRRLYHSERKDLGACLHLK